MAVNKKPRKTDTRVDHGELMDDLREGYEYPEDVDNETWRRSRADLQSAHNLRSTCRGFAEAREQRG